MACEDGVTQPVLQSTRMLTFSNPEVELEYQAFCHRRPLLIMVVALVCSVPNGMLAFVLGNELLYTAMYSGAAFVASMILAYSVLKHWRIPSKQPGIPSLLRLERIVIPITMSVMTVATVAAAMINMLDCAELPNLLLDNRKSMTEKVTCSRWYTFLSVAHTVVMVMIRVVPFPFICASCASVTAFIIIFGLAIGVPEPVYQVWLFAVWHAAASAFLCLAAYQYERTSRNNFRSVKALHALSVKLQEQQRRNREQLHSLLPAAVLRRAGQQSKGDALDTSADGIVLAACIHDFPGWCVRNLPIHVAIQVSSLQSLFREEVEKSSMCPLGSLGDTVVAAGNLLSPIAQPASEAIKASQNVARLLGAVDGLPPRCLVIHMGPLQGGFVSGRRARYAVYGQAYEDALALLPTIGPAEVACAQGVISQAGYSVTCSAFEESSASPNFVTMKVRSLMVLDLLEDAVTDDTDRPVQGCASPPLAVVASVDSDEPHMATGMQEPLKKYLSQSMKYIQRDDESSEATDSGSAAEERIRERIAKATATKKVWCIFTVFADPQMEDEFVQRRTKMLPTAASVTWLGYAALICVILTLGVAEANTSLENNIGVCLLVGAALVAVVMAGVPNVLTQETMRSVFAVWSFVGVLQPLMVVYGAALLRPAAVGTDVRSYILLGTMMRAYCFSSTRWMAIVALLAAIIGLFQYTLPGAVVRGTTAGLWVYGLFIVFGEVHREGGERGAFRRIEEKKLALLQVKRARRLELGLIAAAVPARIFETLVQSREAHEELQSRAVTTEGVALLINGSHRLSNNDGATTFTEMAEQFAPLERFVSESKHLAISAILGDRAPVVGPVFCEPESNTVVHKSWEEALAESLVLCKTLENVAGGSFGCLLDTDPIIHSISNRNGAIVYRALGVATTRLLSIGIGLDTKQFRGTLVSERVLHLQSSFGDLCVAHQEALGPMKFRGVGLVRLSRLVWS